MQAVPVAARLQRAERPQLLPPLAGQRRWRQARLAGQRRCRPRQAGQRRRQARESILPPRSRPNRSKRSRPARTRDRLHQMVAPSVPRESVWDTPPTDCRLARPGLDLDLRNSRRGQRPGRSPQREAIFNGSLADEFTRLGLAGDSVDDLDPVRLLADRILLDGLQLAAVLVDRMDGQAR